MPQLLILILTALLWIPAVLCGVTTVEQLAVLEGQTLTIPCHYKPEYTSSTKYWCHGRLREFCSSLARSDDPSSVDPSGGKVSIFDDPIQLVFTVTMRDVKEADSGWYMCGVEMGGMWTADVVAYTNIKVIHGITAVNSRLSGLEGSSVEVQCLYSEKYRETGKKWCRSGDLNSCLLTGPDGRYEDASVAMSDDGVSSFTVTLKKLQMRDMGWYWCSVGEQQISVHLQVLPSTTAAASLTSATTEPSQPNVSLPAPKPITEESSGTRIFVLESLMVCTAFMLLVGLLIFARKMWKQHKRDAELRQSKEMTVRLNSGYPRDTDEQQNGVFFFNSNSAKAEMC